MTGYWNDPERTAEAIDADGWMHTGDLAVMADDGYVNIVGRIKDMVIRGGENVYPREIEEFLYTHPDVEDVQVIGVPDERYGEELMAWVKLRARRRRSTEDDCGRSAAAASPTTRCRATCKFVDEFPMTVTGKVQKFKMREQVDRRARPRRRIGHRDRLTSVRSGPDPKRTRLVLAPTPNEHASLRPGEGLAGRAHYVRRIGTDERSD